MYLRLSKCLIKVILYFTQKKESPAFLSNCFPDCSFHLKLTQNTVRSSMNAEAIKNNS